jgi:twitching motility protein PilT
MPKLDQIFLQMIEKDASDLFVTPGAPPVFKIHGNMVPLNCNMLGVDACEHLLYELLSPEQKEKFLEELDLDFAYEIPGKARYRGNLFMQRKGVAGAFRYIPAKVKTLDELDMPDVVKKLARSNRGLILVTGATGSGKSTTLAAMIDLRNEERAEHIITLEDPLEFVHENKKSIVHQRQIGDHTKNFASSLRAALREAPDVILVGEMRDLETISLAITAAETGHLVYGTLHTSNAPKTVDRIIDAFPQEQQAQIRTMLGDSLKGVICQNLVKRSDGKGRVAAVEIMLSTPAVANLIREGKTFQIPTVMQTSRKEGMVTYDQYLMELMRRKVIFAEEAFRNAVVKDPFMPFVMVKKEE